MTMQFTPTDESSSSEHSVLQLEKLLEELPNQYALLGKASEGGMGYVFKARNLYTGVFFAIKILKQESASNEALQRFICEAKAASSLKHPNICQVHDFGQTKSGVPYLVMDWIDGISLGKKVLRDEKLSPAEAVNIFQQVVAALSEAHRMKVVHRDLKPDNIMLTRDASGRTEVQVVDFGIAKVLSGEEDVQGPALTRTGMIVGTPAYMSPEQARGIALDGRSDVYSLGCVMYYALTGNAPFLGDTAIDTIAMHLSDPPPDLDPSLKLPADLKSIMFKCMEKDAADRYQSMEQLAVDLKKFSKGVSVDRKPLAQERRSVRKKALVGISFVIGFVAMYLLSMALQNVMDAVPTGAHAGGKAAPARAAKKGL